MTTPQITQISLEMMKMILFLSAPIIVTGMIVGVMVSLVQAVTQIQEQSISFVLKIISAGVAFLVFAPWMLQRMVDFSSGILGNLDMFIR